MNDQGINGQDDKQTSVTKSRPIRPEFLTKIYYPDTLYPDSYTFFADRRSAPMDADEQASTKPSVHTATLPKQIINEIETTERPSKYSVSFVYIQK